MPAHREIHVGQMKPGDRVVWLYSRKRSFLVGYGVRRVAAVVIRVCGRRIRLGVRLHGTERLVNVHPDNLISEEEG